MRSAPNPSATTVTRLLTSSTASRVGWCPSGRMGLLLLLTSTLLSIYFHSGRVTNAQQVFTIKDITLSIEPSTDVTRGTNVTLRCQATISSSGQEALSREYTIFKDNEKIYRKTSSTSEDVLYPLPEARVSNNGKYKCVINIEDKQSTSKDKKLTVTGLSKPDLHINNGVVREGEELMARCTAPGETGSIYFYFYEDSEEILHMQVNSNQAVAKLKLSSTGIHKLHCSYIVSIRPDSFKSEKSDAVTVTVKELPITAVLEIFPQYNIYEGDRLNISCTISNFMNSSQIVHLYLSHGTKLLGFGNSSAVTRVNYNMIAQAKDPGEFECQLEIGNLLKVATKTISVTELFSEPTLTMSPAEVFQSEYMTLTCRSKSYDPNRLRDEELTYTLDPAESSLRHKGKGVFSGTALPNDFNYTCVAQAKGVKKHSKTLTVHPKVSVSIPRISTFGQVILNTPFKILCESDNGSLPINYTLLKDYKVLNTVTVKLPHQKAIFPATITRTDEIIKFRCRAQNSNKGAPLSRELNAAVIVPLTSPILTVIPDSPVISEGDELIIICGVNGTVPVTFKIYREGTEKPLNMTITDTNQTNYRIPVLSKEHSGKYFCEASNYANVVHSNKVLIEVQLALWKKAMIGGVSLLVVSVLVVIGCVLYFRSKRGKREAPLELSVKPSSPKSDDSLTANLTHDKEFNNADTVRVDRAVVSVWSKRPPEDDEADEQESSVGSDEPDVEYTEVVHPLPVDPARVPLRKGTDTVYSELQNSPHGAADHHDYGSVEYAELNGEQTEINNYHPEVNNYQDLPVPVD